MTSVIEDLVTITNIGKQNYIPIFDKIKFIIAHDVEEMILNKQNECEIDIYIGTLKIKLYDKSYTYDFIPSNSMDDLLTGLINGHNKVLAKNINKKIEVRLKSAYKELM